LQKVKIIVYKKIIAGQHINQHKRVWHGTCLEGGSVVISIYLLWWSMVKVRSCMHSLVI